MGAKNDLNEIYFSGCIALSAVIGSAAQSWAVFFLALIVSVGVCGYSRKIR